MIRDGPATASGGPAPAESDWREVSLKEESAMPTYVVLGKITDEGARGVKELAKRARENIQRGEALGLSVKGWYLTQGEYDIVVIVEAPDAETQLLQALSIAMRGQARTN